MRPQHELHDRALDLLVQGEIGRAIPALEEVVALAPDDATAWLELGTAYWASRRWEDAERALARAADATNGTREGRLDVLLLYARALVQTGKYDAAMAQLSLAEAVAEGDARVEWERGIVHYQLREFVKARECLEYVTEAQPRDARAEYARGLVHEALRDTGAAVASYQSAIAKDPSFINAYRALADAFAMSGEHEAAIAVLDKLLEVAADDVMATRNVDVLRRAAKDRERRRLLGKPRRALDGSVLLAEGGFRRLGDDGGTVVRYAAPLVEVWVTVDEGGVINSLRLVLTDPARAARVQDDRFKITVVGEDGERRGVDFATAVHLTFLREALGCAMTEASGISHGFLRQGAPSPGATPRLPSTVRHIRRNRTSCATGSACGGWRPALESRASLPSTEDAKVEHRCVAAGVRDNDVVNKGHAHRLARSLEAMGHQDVLGRGFGIAARVVMHEDDGGGRVTEREAKDVARETRPCCGALPVRRGGRFADDSSHQGRGATSPRARARQHGGP